MTESTTTLAFTDAEIQGRLQALDDAGIDQLEFGVIGFDPDTVVRRYNAFEVKNAGLSPRHVIGHPLFTVVAPCMNNYMVAQRFEDAAANHTALDATIAYVLTLRMRPAKVTLRLLASAKGGLRYLLISGRS